MGHHPVRKSPGESAEHPWEIDDTWLGKIELYTFTGGCLGDPTCLFVQRYCLFLGPLTKIVGFPEDLEMVPDSPLGPP